MAILKSFLFVFIVFCFIKKKQLGWRVDGSSLDCPLNERNALYDFKQNLIDQTYRLSSWVGQDCCKWEGVSCDNFTGHVLKLDLRNPFPLDMDRYFDSRSFYDKTYSEACLVAVGEVNLSLLELKHLKYLDLSWNNFSGISIPKFFGLFSKLTYLNLSSAQFGGIVPHQLGNLSALHSLDLGTDFLLSDNYHKIPSLVVNTLQWSSNLYSLQILDMSGIDLSNIPLDSFQTITSFPSLLELHSSDCLLDMNFVHHSNLENLTSLTILDLSHNLFKGLIPSVIRNLTSIKVLQLSNNQFSSNGLIFDELKNLNKLEVLHLSNNMFVGKINESGYPNFSSPSIGDNLLELDLSHNKFTRYLPNWLHKLKSRPSIIHLSYNSFEGEIPTSLSGLQSLKELRLSSNQLSGPIPTFLTKLSTLKVLNLGRNFFSGRIPTTLGRMSTLTYLDLSYNQLSGDIPMSLGKLSNLKTLYLLYNQFNGSLPTSIGQCSQLTDLNLDNNQFNGVVSELHLARLFELKHLNLNMNSLLIKIRSGWVPPFQLQSVRLGSCSVGPRFPDWLQTQTGLKYLDMSSTSISDPIPSWFLNLTSLVELDLSGNQIHGNVPNFTTNMEVLYLYSNRFEGSLPPFPSNLQVLDLSNNTICGHIPTDIGYTLPHLRIVSLANNNINGTIPNSLCQLLSLSFLDFSKNKLSGVLPHCWDDLHEVEAIDLSSNTLSGTIHRLFLHQSMYLKSLHMNKNNFHGEFPLSLQNYTSLSVLDLSDNNFSGEIPTWIGQRLHSLRILKLSSNKYNGGLSPMFCHLNKLQVLDIAGNNLSGNIPQCFGSFTAMLINQTNFSDFSDSLGFDDISQVIKGREYEYSKTLGLLTSLDLSNNNLVGKIPEQLTNLSGLISFNLSKNHLTGSIPMKIGQMKSLESLDLSNNQLSGTIPQSISAITTLSYLNLSNNNLYGAIPSGNQLQTLNASSYEGNKELCGFPLEKKCTYGDRKEKINEEEDGDGFITMWFYIGMTCGCVVVFVGFCVVLLLKKSWRYAYSQFLNDIINRLFYTTAKRNV